MKLPQSKDICISTDRQIPVKSMICAVLKFVTETQALLNLIYLNLQ